jgi:truncated hemoglobin YjbI
MRITKRQLRRIIKEEKAKLNEQSIQYTEDGARIYEVVTEQVMELVGDTLNNYGTDDIVVEAIMDALKDAANMVINDARLMQ